MPDTPNPDTPRAARLLAARPLALLGEQFHRTGGPVDVRGRLVHVQRARQHTVPHRLHHLDHTGDTGGGLRVADVGLDRAQPQGLCALLAVGGQQRLGFDRVAEPGARAVRLHRVDLAGGQAGVGQCLADHALLGEAVGAVSPAARAVLVDRGAADDGQHGVAVAAGVREPFEDEHAGALGEAEPVGRRGERLAAAVGRAGPLPAVLGEHGGRGHARSPPGERQRALAGAQRADGEVQGDQGGGAGGVDGEGGALQAEGVGDPAGEHAGRRCR